MRGPQAANRRTRIAADGWMLKAERRPQVAGRRSPTAADAES